MVWSFYGLLLVTTKIVDRVWNASALVLEISSQININISNKYWQNEKIKKVFGQIYAAEWQDFFLVCAYNVVAHGRSSCLACVLRTFLACYGISLYDRFILCDCWDLYPCQKKATWLVLIVILLAYILSPAYLLRLFFTTWIILFL